MKDAPSVERPIPEGGLQAGFYWTSGADGRLRLAQCSKCLTYIHPPQPYCATCGSEQVDTVVVSGRGRVATHTVNEQQWIPGLAVPYVFAAVELEEQAQLYVVTNIVNCPVEAVHTGMPVEVLFEQQDDLFIPLFQPQGGGNA
jgi:uncharacterized OB-fold protein